MKKDWGDYITDILNAIDEVEEFTKGMGFEAFLTDKKTINAVIRSLEVLGEAAKRIPRGYKRKAPQYSLEADGRHARQTHS